MDRGRKIKKAREKKGLTQENAAHRVGLPVSTWARVERGESDDPKASTLRKIAKALRMKIENLI